MASLHLATQIFDLIYPVGSIYMSVNSTNPSSYFGGTWSVIAQGRTLVGVNTSDTDFASAGKTGGEKKHTLTIEEMPNHAHEQYVTANPGSGGHGIRRDWDEDANGLSTYPQGCSTSSVGGGNSHNNLQPYYCVYIFKRTA